jgi:Flp pilus assembly protein TadG
MRRRLRSDEGSEALEFALVFPVAAFLLIALLYGLFAVSAHVSLAHATSRGARFASIPSDLPSGTYPTTSDIEAFIDDQTPFFSASSCATSVAGDAVENAPVVLDVTCDFPNPLGRFAGFGEESLHMSARAEARRE